MGKQNPGIIHLKYKSSFTIYFMYEDEKDF